MLEEEITKLREKLNKSIANDEKYEIIYKLSIELDELITKYYIKRVGNDVLVAPKTYCKN